MAQPSRSRATVAVPLKLFRYPGRARRRHDDGWAAKLSIPPRHRLLLALLARLSWVRASERLACGPPRGPPRLCAAGGRGFARPRSRAPEARTIPQVQPCSENSRGYSRLHVALGVGWLWWEQRCKKNTACRCGCWPLLSSCNITVPSHGDRSNSRTHEAGVSFALHFRPNSSGEVVKRVLGVSFH